MLPKDGSASDTAARITLSAKAQRPTAARLRSHPSDVDDHCVRGGGVELSVRARQRSPNFSASRCFVWSLGKNGPEPSRTVQTGVVIPRVTSHRCPSAVDLRDVLPARTAVGRSRSLGVRLIVQQASV